MAMASWRERDTANQARASLALVEDRDAQRTKNRAILVQKVAQGMAGIDLDKVDAQMRELGSVVHINIDISPAALFPKNLFPELSSRPKHLGSQVNAAREGFYRAVQQYPAFAAFAARCEAEGLHIAVRYLPVSERSLGVLPQGTLLTISTQPIYDAPITGMVDIRRIMFGGDGPHMGFFDRLIVPLEHVVELDSRKNLSTWRPNSTAAVVLLFRQTESRVARPFSRLRRFAARVADFLTPTGIARDLSAAGTAPKTSRPPRFWADREELVAAVRNMSEPRSALAQAAARVLASPRGGGALGNFAARGILFYQLRRGMGPRFWANKGELFTAVDNIPRPHSFWVDTAAVVLSHPRSGGPIGDLVARSILYYQLRRQKNAPEPKQ